MLLDEDTLQLVQPIELATIVRQAKIARVKAIATLREQVESSSILLEGEDASRERYICQVRMHAIEAATELESIKAEVELLKSANRAFTQEKVSFDKPVGSVSKITQPFVLLKDRQKLVKDVFRPGHSLPTMTIDEYLQLERQRGGILPVSGKTPSVEENDDDDDEIVDRKTMKDRQFDLFKDDNRRGWGNTYNLG
jgi:hypothetical protein